MNVIDTCIDQGIKRVVALSTDKKKSYKSLWRNKVNSDKLFVASNSYSPKDKTSFSVVRYGNVMGSRGSVIPFFMSIKNNQFIPITDERMTRFVISLDKCVELVLKLLKIEGGEIYVKKIPSIKITDIAKVIAPKSKFKIIGIRPGEKLHEQMISNEYSYYTYEYSDYFKILPQI